MKRAIATLATVLAVAGTTSFVVVESNTERPVVAADSQSDSREDDHRSSRSETRQPLVLEVEQMAIDKRTNQKAVAERKAKELVEAQKRAVEKKAREDAARKAALAAALEKARKQARLNSKPTPNKTGTSQRSYQQNKNHVAPGGIAACIRKYESGGNYRAVNPSSGASGAYQFMDATWQSVTGLSGKAMNYSPAQQDAAFWKLWNNGKGAHNWVTAPRCGY
jgi:Transglycosylase-like domain